MSDFSRNLAFMIGINNYTNGISPLQNAENDAKKLVELLREKEILKAINVHRDKLRVVFTLRSDFEPQVRDAGLKLVPTVINLGNTVLKNRWQSGRFIVPAMTLSNGSMDRLLH